MLLLRARLAFLGLLISAAPASAASPLERAQAALQAGRYAEAESLFRKQRSGQADLGLARVLLETGRYQQAAQLAGQAARGKLWAPAQTLVGEAQRLLGQLPRAEQTLEQVVGRSSKSFRARALLGLVYHEQGKEADARAVFDSFYDDYAAGAIDKSSAEQLTYVAQACRYTDNFRDASDTYRDALQADPDHLEAYLGWAEISLEKYEAGYAEQHYGELLKRNPHHAQALVGLAQVKLEQANDVEAASELLQRAEQTNPQSIAAKVVRARMMLDAEQHTQAEALLQAALAQNQNHLDALSLLAASHFLRDDPAGFGRLKKRVLGLNPRHTKFFQDVMAIGMRQHRYAECVALGQEAVQIDPRDWVSLAELGTNYLRLGQEEKGLEALRQAWKGDPFNVRTYNLLNLYEDVLAKEYTFVSSRHFRLRVHQQERELIQRTVLPVLERAFAKYVKKYRFTPKTPVIVEFYREPEHYAVRTVGLPGLAALGVCFGQVITAISPTNGRFNWGQVVWHELNHVFSIQLSRSRVPRWLTEGLADLEPMLERPEWKRENDFDIYRALTAGRLKGLASLNTAFTQAKSIDEMVVAYYLGSLLVRYLIDNWGLPKVVRALRLYGQGAQTPAILRQVTGLELAELDQRFQAAELRRLQRYSKVWFFDPESHQELEAAQQRATATPQDAQAQAELAAALLLAGQREQAQAAAKRALVLAKDHKLALYVSAQLSAAAGDGADAVRSLEALLASGGDGPGVRLLLGKLHLQQKALDKAELHLGRAKQLDPEEAAPYALLAQAYERSQQTDRAIAELQRLVQLDQQSLESALKLVRLLAQRSDWAAVRRYGLLAYYIQPGDAALHALLARAYRAAAPQPDLKRAIWHLETALLCQPEKPAALQLELAQLHLDRKDRARARAAIEAALAAEPGNAKALQLQKRLGP